MNSERARPVLIAALLIVPWALAPGDDEPRTLDARMHHLGDDATPDWPEAPLDPEPADPSWHFEARANAGEQVLAVRQRHVDNLWTLVLNGAPLAELARHADLREQLYPIPAGALRDGDNVLQLVASAPSDDITFGDLRLYPVSLAALLDLVPLALSVRDARDGGPVPARLTLVDEHGQRPRLHTAEAGLALRDGVVYTADGDARVQLPRGRYTVWAQRGTEWSRARAEIDLTGAGAELALSIERELDTTGYVATDTHLHTLTFSGHGDASLDERQITLAGEGVELAIATDHNHNTDYAGASARLSTSSFFTPVTGNEVTTPLGHFNAFPLDPADPVPPHELRDWTATVEGMRAAGAKVVILNHPRWPSFEGGPFGIEGLDRSTGERASGAPFTFDALELVNSTDDQPEPMVLLEDWFALLNRGQRLVAVGSSDSHTVGDPVGQGRTYVSSSGDDPAAIDVDEAATNLAAGRASVSLGIVTDVRVDARHGMGDLVPAGAGTVDVALRVAAPGWVHPEQAELFVDGRSVALLPIDPVDGPVDVWTHVQVALPDHDAWLVVVVRGPAVDGPGWPSLNAYTLAFTNPVFFDRDGDGVWSSPREVGQRQLERALGDGAELDPASLAGLDDAAAVHYLDGLRGVLTARAARSVRELGETRADASRALSAFIDGLR